MQARAPRRRGHSGRNNTIEKERFLGGQWKRGGAREREREEKKYSFVKNV
jgi:hypothetical protein